MIVGSYNQYFITSMVVVAVIVCSYNQYFITYTVVVAVIVVSYNQYFITFRFFKVTLDTRHIKTDTGNNGHKTQKVRYG